MADDTSTRTRPRGSLTREEIIQKALALLEAADRGHLVRLSEPPYWVGFQHWLLVLVR